MDEEQALLVIQLALDLVRAYYETLLFDKIQGKVEYPQQIGFSDILKAIGKVSRRIEEIEHNTYERE